MRNLCVFLCMTVMAGLAGFAAAGQGFQATFDPADGWEQVSEGYWQRITEDGKLQRVAIGPAGLQTVLAGLKDELTTLVDDYLNHPDEEMLEILQGHLDHIAVVEKNLENSKAVKASLLPAPWCNIDWDANVGTGPGCRNWANAFTSYYGSTPQQCFGQCAIYARAYTRRQLCDYSYVYDYETEYTSSTFNDEVDAEAALSSSAVRNCYSYGLAYINCPDYGYYQEEFVDSSSCGLCRACAEVAHEDVD